MAVGAAGAASAMALEAKARKRTVEQPELASRTWLLGWKSADQPWFLSIIESFRCRLNW